jgi:lipoprotein-anchoring transpeptidase ErfK/SrfK
MQYVRELAFSSILFAANVIAVPAAAAPIDTDPVRIQRTQHPAPERIRLAAATRGNMGGGLIEALFGGDSHDRSRGPVYRRSGPGEFYPRYEIQPAIPVSRQPFEPGYGFSRSIDPKYERQMVAYEGKEAPRTIVIDTPNKFLYLVQGGGRALRYGIGVGRPGFTWAGMKTVSAKREWPDWRPPDEMLKRRPDLPRYMPGGPENPLGARALYLGSSLYRIHGSNEPWTIGTAVSSGCIRMRNEDVIDLYQRVQVGARVLVI